MACFYIGVLTVFVSFCCMKYFNVAVDQMKILGLIGTVGCLCMGLYFQLSFLILMVLRDLIICGMIKKAIDQDNKIEILAMILFLETIAKCSYYVLILAVPLIVHVSIADAMSFHNYWLQIVALAVMFFVLKKYYDSSSFLKLKCDRMTYVLIAVCSLIAVCGLEIIPNLVYTIEEYQLYFLLLAFVYVVVLNIIIYIYHHFQMQRETSHRIALEQLSLLKQEKDMIAVQRKMIDDIRHDLKYFQSMVNNATRDHISATVKKIDAYDQRFLFNDYLFNSFIDRMKSEMKDHHKDLKIMITDTNIAINLNVYNQLLSIMEMVIADSIQSHIHFRVDSFDEMTVFEFTYIYGDHHQYSSSLASDKNIIFSQKGQEQMTCSLIMEGV